MRSMQTRMNPFATILQRLPSNTLSMDTVNDSKREILPIKEEDIA
jgi:hypothetical protein